MAYGSEYVSKASSQPKDTCIEVRSVLYTGFIGDGCYLMGCRGDNYTHAEKEHNAKLTGLIFTTGDEVTVEFDPIRRIVAYTVAYATANNGGQHKRYEQSISTGELFFDSVHFCACPCPIDEVGIK
jgi:hypothetical protein